MKGLRKTIHKFLTYIDMILVKTLSSSKIGAKLYFLFSKAFTEEQFRVLNGMAVNLRSSGKGNIYNLRRNIHRLEKALCLKELKPVFAEGYIRETVKDWVFCSKDLPPEYGEELSWAHDVLTEYFERVNKVAGIKTAFEEFNLHSQKLSEGKGCSESKCPYTWERKDPIGYSTLMEFFRMRKSFRFYTSRKVEREVLEKAAYAALLAPSACNRQPISIHFILERERIEKVRKITLGFSGFSDFVPAVAVITGSLSAYRNMRDRHALYLDGGLLTMLFLLALESLGLGACTINWPEVSGKDEEMKRLLQLKKEDNILLLVSIGYPDQEGKIAYSHRKNIETFIRY